MCSCSQRVSNKCFTLCVGLLAGAVGGFAGPALGQASASVAPSSALINAIAENYEVRDLIAGAQRSSLVEPAIDANFSALHEQQRLLFNLFADINFDVELVSVERGAGANLSLRGVLHGKPFSSVQMGYFDGALFGEINPANGLIYRIEAVGPGLSRVVEIVEDEQPFCGTDGLEERGVQVDPAAQGGGLDGEIGPVDILIVYTPRAETAWGGLNQVRAQARQFVLNTNRYLQFSDCSTRVRLVGLERTNYTESGDSGNDLDRLRGQLDGFMDEIHPLRNALGADMVALIADVSDVCGIGYLYSGSDTRAFSLTDPGCGSQTFAHELGHNFGCCHNPEAAGGGGGCFDAQSFGYAFTGDSTRYWRTLMAYPPGLRIENFSNPNLRHDGQPFGTATAFNAATIDTTAADIATYRAAVAVADCNQNFIIDSLDIASGASGDSDADGVPNECEASLSGWVNRSADFTTRPSARQNHAMAFDVARGVTVLVHGDVNGSRNRETWEFNGAAWTQRSTSGPLARREHALAHDAGRQRTVLFGGNTSSGRNAETWEWNGTAWTQRSISGPSARQNHAMAYDSFRGVVVLFGGNLASGRSDETWEYSGTAWTQRTPANRPSAREGHTLVYDPVRQRTYLFGGTDADGDSNQVWAWDGNDWVRVFAVMPTSRRDHAMVFDTSRNVSVLFGGNDGGAFNGSTWTWNGTTWSLQTAAGATGRANHGMAYDSARGVAVLFGGAAASSNQETWELLNRNPTITQQPQDAFRCSGQSVTLSLSATTFQGSPLAYQWRRNGSNIPTATAASYTISAVSAASEGSYDCVVSNAFGLTFSEAAFVDVGAGPSIILQPPAQVIVNSGQPSSIQAFVEGAEPLSLQWQRNGNDVAAGPRIAGVTTQTLAINPVLRADAGQYTLRTTDACGTVSTTAARLRVVDRGDMNCDGAITFDDIAPFVTALVSEASYAAQYPNCERLNADANSDSLVNFADIDSFVVLLVGG